MAKKPDTPCAGCGKLLWSSGTSLPLGQRKCRDCRKNDPTASLSRTPRTCAACSQQYYSPQGRAQYCSLQCAAVAKAKQPPPPERYRPRPCVDCGDEVRNSSRLPVCSVCLVPRTAERYRSKCRRRRALKLGAEAEKYTLVEIAGRDNHRCGLCRSEVDMTLRSPDPWSPTIDHIVPLSLGGDDTRANVWLTHRVCNLRKSNRTDWAQLTWL